MKTILLDKSAFQDLVLEDLRASWGKYQMLATDVLLLEVLGDLRYGGNRTTAFAGKLRSSNVYVNMPHHLLCGNELLGKSVPMQKVPVLEGYEVRDSSGSRGTYIPPSEGDDSLLRWAEGNFDDQDIEFAETWIEGIRNIDLEALEREIRLGLPREQRPNSIADIVSAIDISLRSRDMQKELLQIMLAHLAIPEEWVEPIQRRWSDGSRWLLDNAPYTAFCARVTFAFIGAIGGRMIGTKRSNFVDAQYLMYLPFCDIFASSDKMHAALFPFVCMPGQEILTAQALKERIYW